MVTLTRATRIDSPLTAYGSTAVVCMRPLSHQWGGEAMPFDTVALKRAHFAPLCGPRSAPSYSVAFSYPSPPSHSS